MSKDQYLYRPGGCFQRALEAAGYDCTGLVIPEWVSRDEAEEILALFGLRFEPPSPPPPAEGFKLDGDRWYLVELVTDQPFEGHATCMQGRDIPPDIYELVLLPQEG